MNPDGSHIRELTFSRVADSVHRSRSPDGSALVFSRFFADKAEVWAMNADGTITRSPTVASAACPPTPERQADRLRKYISPTDDGLWIMKTDGTHMRRSHTIRFPAAVPPASVTRSLIGHRTENNSRSQGSRPYPDRRCSQSTWTARSYRLTEWAMNATTPVWSPDGGGSRSTSSAAGIPEVPPHLHDPP